MITIGMTGTLGAGKGTVVDYLKSKGFAHYSASGFITEEIVRRGMKVDRDAMSIVANDLRAIHSPSYIIEQLYARAIANGRDSVIESIQTVGEAEALRAAATRDGFRTTLIAVDADIRARYERIVKRGSVKDNVSFETFEQTEEDEMNSTDPTRHNIAGVMRLADYTVNNDGTLDELNAQVDDILAKLS